MKNKILLCIMIIMSIFFLVGCDNSESEDHNDYQYNDEGEKTDDIGWTEEDWDRYY